MRRIMFLFGLLLLVLATLSGCATIFGPPLPPIIITGPAGIQSNQENYKVIRIKNIGPAYWRFWLGYGSGQQVVLYPGSEIFVKLSSNFSSKCGSFWVHSYMEVDKTGRVVVSSFMGEQLVQYCLTGSTWVCDSGRTIGADIVLSGVPQSNYPFPTHFTYSIPLIPVGIQGGIQ